MDWAKAKTILIIVFTAVNIYIVIFWGRHRRYQLCYNERQSK